MGLLTPLYALAALAIVGPILFHLIRRQPQGQQQFSSLMFLQPSPPTLTRRSRIDHWLLLLMRALALGLIAIAFARPYWRESSLLQTNLEGRNIVVLLDTSASMQRDEVWQSAKSKLDDLLNSLSPEDRISLYTINDRVTPVIALEPATSQAATTQDAVRQASQELEPTWRRTQLGSGLANIADSLSALRISGEIPAGKSSEVVLITDLHQESALESLQGFPWPELVTLDVRQVLPSVPGNARGSLMTGDVAKDDEVVKIRIENNSDSDNATLELAWSDEKGPVDATAISRVQVPAGQVRVVPMPEQPQQADRVVLLGDAWAGDNDVYVAQVQADTQRILFVANAQMEKEEDAGYFLSVAPLSTPLVERRVSPVVPSEFSEQLLTEDVGSIVLEPDSQLLEQTATLREFASDGGTVLLTLSRESDPSVSQPLVRRLLDVDSVVVQEASIKNEHALIGWVDYRSPTFAPFADPRFNDFSKIRFWSHRRVEFPTEDSEDDEDVSTSTKVVAKYDDGDALLIHKRHGEGHIWILTAGWQPRASGLALSSKFLPILSGMLDPFGYSRKLQPVYEVGESIETSDSIASISDVDGNPLSEEQVTIEASSYTVWQPGLYTVESDDLTQQIAVQVPASESRLTPLDPDIFEQYGIELGKVVSDAQRQETARQMQVEELEGKQRLWQWLIAGCILLLAAESFLAGRIARAQGQPAAAAS